MCKIEIKTVRDRSEIIRHCNSSENELIEVLHHEMTETVIEEMNLTCHCNDMKDYEINVVRKTRLLCMFDCKKKYDQYLLLRSDENTRDKSFFAENAIQKERMS